MRRVSTGRTEDNLRLKLFIMLHKINNFGEQREVNILKSVYYKDARSPFPKIIRKANI
jgi:hypothetical protein